MLPRRHGLEYPPARTTLPTVSDSGGGSTVATTRAGPNFSGPSAAHTAAAGSDLSGSGNRLPIAGTISVQVLQAYYQQLPHYGHQQFAVSREVSYSVLDAQQRRTITTPIMTVPRGRVAIVTDFFGYATAPGAGLAAAPVQLSPYQLTGLFKFALRIGGTIALLEDAATISPNAAVGTGVTGVQTGWPFLDTPVGSRRSAGFAIYARASQQIDFDILYEDVPQFQLSKLGVHVHGFTTSEAEFEAFVSVNR